jgi:hypothetical protein
LIGNESLEKGGADTAIWGFLGSVGSNNSKEQKELCSFGPKRVQNDAKCLSAEREGKEPYGFPRLFSMIWTRNSGQGHRIIHRMIWVILIN